MSCPRLFEAVDAEHLATCSECRAVQGALRAPEAVDLERLKGPALAALQASPRVTRWWVPALVLLAVTVGTSCLCIAMMSPSTTQHASLALRHASAAAWALMILAGGLLAVMPGARFGRGALLAGVAVCFGLTLVAASGYDAGRGVGCSLAECAIALVPVVVALVVLTGFAFDVMRGLSAGIAAASAGMLAMHLHCPDGTLSHQALCHLLPTAVLAGVVVLVRSRLRSRTYAP